MRRAMQQRSVKAWVERVPAATQTLLAIAACAVLGGNAGCGGSGGTQEVAPEQRDFTGSWVLDAEESDDPQELMQEMGAAGGRQGMMGGQRPGGGGGRPGARPGGGRPPSGGGIDPERMRYTRQLAMQTHQRFAVSHTDSAVSITYGDGRTVTLYTDGRKVKQEVEQGWQLETKAEWNGKYLVVEREVDDGGKIIDQYFLSPESDRLFIVTKLEIGRMQSRIQLRQVYDRVQGS